jgi:hypothetical protein
MGPFKNLEVDNDDDADEAAEQHKIQRSHILLLKQHRVWIALVD